MPRNFRDKACESCGATYRPASGSQKYCPKCRPDKEHGWVGVAVRNRLLKNRHGMTSDEYEALYIDQLGWCAACGQPETVIRNGKTMELAVDHDHRCCSSDKSCPKCRRGLLCMRCNQTLGRVHDDPELLRRLAEYLEQWHSKIVI